MSHCCNFAFFFFLMLGQSSLLLWLADSLQTCKCFKGLEIGGLLLVCLLLQNFGIGLTHSSICGFTFQLEEQLSSALPQLLKNAC